MKLQNSIEQLLSKSLQIKTFETGHVCLTAHEVDKPDEMLRVNGEVLFNSIENLFVSLKKSMHETDTKRHSSVSVFRLEPFGMLSLSKHTSHEPVNSIDELILLHAEYLV